MNLPPHGLTQSYSRGKLRSSLPELLSDADVERFTQPFERELATEHQFEGIIARSAIMWDVFARVRRAAPHFRTVLITGTTGTGKELIARALHRLSPVAGQPLVVCNCSAIVETLLESELFGYVRGAFTGATHDKVGVFEYADHGTVFLDEIGELPLAAQSKLLRVLQNREIQRVGSHVAKNIDIRVIAATNRDLRSMVRAGKFREDLYYRLAMVEIALPRLTERREDLHLLQTYFVEKFASQYDKKVTGITRRAQTRLEAYSWPGNIRELENAIGNACMMVDGTVIDIGDLPEPLRDQPGNTHGTDESLMSLDELQTRHTMRVLELVGGNKSLAAQILGISRATIYEFLAHKKAGSGAL